ncbi:hypothetical protein AUK40_05500 [Candidatus Wirthbacteria bacterium CG2_30_54_11]|uniref:LamG-like jellyroll fold domain-containing protein n=1 Tax=Candidatus Wirthbacteria bacterium CG2_30_54_11 TaxID=1817892 RepID=A0A1J5IFY0_9BACT|nr:MAG: hypothetical protein AUK40_05500 [Candidatus Wirthbacteria bacterium CG2_30_54_11]
MRLRSGLFTLLACLAGLVLCQQASAAEVMSTGTFDADGAQFLVSDAVQDVFAYNTFLDSDGGAWRKDLNAQDQSWYTEKVKLTRGNRDDFPVHAYLILTDSSLEIIDAEEQKLWMRFTEGAGHMLPAGDHYAVTALNGKIYVASNTRLTVIDFIHDSASYYDAGGVNATTGTIQDRNEVLTWTGAAGDTVADSVVNDVSVTVMDGVTYVAVATESGVSLLNETTGDVNDYYDVASNDDTNEVVLMADGTLYYTNESDGDLEVYYSIENDVGDQNTPDFEYDTATTPALLANPGATRYPLIATYQTSNIDATRHTLYIGSAFGVTVLQENASPNESNGSVKYMTNAYITEEMIGDVRGMWTLEDDAGDFQDRSKNNNDLLDMNTVLRNVPAVRGEGITLSSGSQEYLHMDYNSDFDFGTGSFSQSGWFSHPDTSGGQVSLTDRTDGSEIGWQLYLNTTGELVGRVSDDGTNWDTVTGADSVDDDAWHQFTLVWEPGAALTLYVDGLESGQDAALQTVGSISGTTPVLDIGRDHDGSEYFDGDLDELMISAEALTAQQIWDMYQKGNAAFDSLYDNYLSGSTTSANGLAALSDGRVLWTGTNDGAAGGALSVVKIGETGDYATSTVKDILNADSTFLTYTTATTPALPSNNITSVSMSRAQQREFLVVGTDTGALGMISGYTWYSASDSYTHGGILDSGGKCSASATFQLCDSLGQVFTMTPMTSTSYSLYEGYEYDDRDAPVGPVLLVGSPTTEIAPQWQWENVWDRNGVEGYYMRIGTTENGEEFMAPRWLGFIHHFTQDPVFAYAGTYYAQLKVRDKVGNEGRWGPTTVLVVQPSMTFIVEGVSAGTPDLGSGSSEKETTDIDSWSAVIDFGTLPVNEPVVAAQKLILTMNLGEGYVVTAQHDQPMWAASNDQDVISPFAATNLVPEYWSAAPLGHIGYHTDDVTLSSVGNGPARFRGTADKFAGLSTVPQEVMYGDTGPTSDTAFVVYKIQISPTILPGRYHNQVTYIATATF